MPESLLIVNPAARGGRSALDRVLRERERAGLVLRVERTQRPGDAAQLARAQESEAPVFVLGGDGTVMEVVGALAGRQVPVGIIPGGTGNQLARLLRIPLDVAQAVQALAQGEPRRLDLGRLDDGRHFALTAGFGLDAAMIAGASPAAKRRLGVGAYVLSAARALPPMRPFDVRIEADGQVWERRAGLAMIANVGAVMDGRFGLGPDVQPDDGWLNVSVLSPESAVDGLALAWRMARRDFRPDARTFFVRARNVRLTVEGEVPAQADGELIAAQSLAATVQPGAACFLAPARPARIFKRSAASATANAAAPTPLP